MSSLEKIKALHQEGRLQEAEQGYLELLKSNKKDVTVLHLLSLLYAEKGEFSTAENFLVQALAIEPGNANIQLHLANIYKATRRYELAIKLLSDLINHYPDFSAAYNNLGTIYYMQGKWPQALQAFEHAIERQSNYVDAYYNLGLTHVKLNQVLDGRRFFAAVLELSSGHVGAHFQLACLLMQAENYLPAIEHLNFILKNHPYHFESKTNLATCLFKIGKLEEAKKYYLDALGLSSQDTQVIFNLAVIESQLGNMQLARDYYLQAINFNSEFFEANYNLAVLLLHLKDPENALVYLKKTLKLQPDNKNVQHLIDILLQDKNITHLPVEFVTSLFDSYAGHYDAHLTRVLNYRLPQIISELIQKITEGNYQYWSILDLGCGTGLCGECLKVSTNKIIGVDLSSKMLDLARKKNIYDELILADAVSFLKNCHDKFELIIAGDVLGYIGDLQIFFPAIRQALKHKGFFIFSAEISKEEGYQINSSGRFIYNRRYLDKLIIANGLHIVDYQVITLRAENYTAVSGHLYALRK